MKTARNARVLLVEDDPATAETVRDAVNEVCAAIDHVTTVGEAAERIADHSFDAVVLDLGLPDGSGLDFAHRLRSNGLTVPILVLTARSSLPDRLEGFARGADDYLCKPFAPAELAARLLALLRRAELARSHLLSYGGLVLDLLDRSARRGANSVALSDRETSLLTHFMRYPEQAISREELAQDVFGLDPDAETGVVNVYVNYLRNKLEHDLEQPRLIHTIRGTGYMLSVAPPGEHHRKGASERAG